MVSEIKIPGTFRPKKSLDKNIESLLKEAEKGYKSRDVDELKKTSSQFLLENNCSMIDCKIVYDRASAMIENLEYTLKDVEELSRRTEIGVSIILGLYISALINRIITEKDIVTLSPNEKLSCLGIYMPKGTMIIQRDVNNYVGAFMKSGNIMVKGNAMEYSGHHMKGGSIEILGNVTNHTGSGNEGGKITVDGNSNNYTGYYMAEGSLTVKGNSNYRTGFSMSGGELVIEGNTYRGTGSAMYGGKLIVKGKITRMHCLKKISKNFEKGTIIHGTKIIKHV
ncbi:MAG: hypothetical protein KKA79_04470 [Nanoarchaeota archaeon]|nr:hypothetical protein [Nanoarchaeota archaeon]MCG2718175.1 hypothetical protein [Nanoarchaeota archaeon]